MGGGFGNRGWWWFSGTGGFGNYPLLRLLFPFFLARLLAGPQDEEDTAAFAPASRRVSRVLLTTRELRDLFSQRVTSGHVVPLSSSP